MFAHVTVMTPLSDVALDAATLASLSSEVRARLQSTLPGADLVIKDDGYSLWAAVAAPKEGDEPADVYWPAVHATRAAVISVAGDARIALGQYGPRTDLPPALR